MSAKFSGFDDLLIEETYYDGEKVIKCRYYVIPKLNLPGWERDIAALKKKWELKETKKR